MDEDRTPTVVVLGDVNGPAFHVGDEAMLEACVTLVRRAEPTASVRVLGRAATRHMIAETVAGADAAVIAGGASLADGWPQLLDQRLVLLSEAARHGIPAVTGGQTLVPSLSGQRREELARALAGVALLGTRDRPSNTLALELGVEPLRVVYQADDTFWLAGTPPDDDVLLAVVDEPYIAVTLDGSYASDDAVPALQALASQIASLATDLGVAVVFVPHCGTLGECEGDDPRAGGRLAALLRLAGARCHVSPVLPVGESIWLAQHAALTISSRYHPLVFATAAARPCIGLHRDHFTQAKLEGALTHVGAERWALSTAEAEAGELGRAVRELWTDRAAICDGMAQARVGLDDREDERRVTFLRTLGLSVDDGSKVRRRPGASAPSSSHVVPLAPRTEESTITDEQWDRFSRDGFLHLAQVLDPEEVERLTGRADDLALGRVQNEHVQMQMDTGGAYEDLPDAVAAFDEGTLRYRKIQGLELDEEFASLVRHQRFRAVCARMYGPHIPLSIFRAMVMNKPAGQGTVLPWHQDGGDVWALDREPLVTIWVALDPATPANGCMEAVRGSHRLGLLSDHGSTLSEEDVARHCPADRVVTLEVPAGHAVFMHNWLIHRSGVNPSTVPRRAVTICYLDGRTRSVLTGNGFPVTAGSVGSASHPYAGQWREDAIALRATAAASEEYARSLEAALDETRGARAEVEKYAKSLEADRDRLAAELAAVQGPPSTAG